MRQVLLGLICILSSPLAFAELCTPADADARALDSGRLEEKALLPERTKEVAGESSQGNIYRIFEVSARSIHSGRVSTFQVRYLADADSLQCIDFDRVTP